MAPDELWTVTSTVPKPCGETAVMEVEETKVTEAAGAPPKLTFVPAVKPFPVIVTVVPPVAGPATGLMALITGRYV